MWPKAFRLFVSSTFADFKVEREALQKQVFPRLNAYCASKGYQLYLLDMRWGVSEEAQLDQRTAEICLAEVRGALEYPPPNFLVMLGNRYGWVPLPYAIAADEFEAMVAWLESQGRDDEAGAICAAYERDNNRLVPPGLVNADDTLVSAYTLRSRADIPELIPAELWAKLEATIRQALQETVQALLALGQIDASVHAKYFMSLTEREIRAALAADQTAGPAAIAFVRDLTNATAKNARYVEDEPRLAVLKDAVTGLLGKEQVLTASAALGKNGELDGFHLEAYVRDIESVLKAAIDRHIAHTEALELSPDFALKYERATHRAFGAQKMKVFVGRENDLAAIERYLEGESEQPFVLHGRSGLGKSALIASAVQAAEEKAAAPMIARFVGASTASSNLRSLLISLVDDLAALGLISKPAEFDQDASKFHKQIAALLSSIDRRVIIVLDALDQLQAPRSLEWLPSTLPPHAKLVVSVLDDPAYESDSDVYRSLKQRLAPQAFLEVQPLSQHQGREILLALERENRRRLQEGQRDHVLAHFAKAGASPLYLKTAFEIVKSWKGPAVAGEGRHVLASETSAVIEQFIDELSSTHHHEPELVARTLGLIAAGKSGLSESELAQLLSGDESVMRAISSEIHGAVTDWLPASVWVRLRRDLAPFLVEKLIDEQSVLQFFHRQVIQVVRERLSQSERVQLHKWLATYFERPAEKQDTSAIYSKRSLSELPYQLHYANERAQLSQILESPGWIKQKVRAFGIEPLVSEYEQFGRGELQKLIGRALELAHEICARDPRQLMPQLHARLLNQKDAGNFCQAALQAADRPALFARKPSLTPAGAETTRLEQDAAILALTQLPGMRLASGCSDGTIRLWDLATHRETGRFVGHSDWVTALVVLDDIRLASGCGDGSIRVWDLATGREAGYIKGDPRPITALLALPDGRLASGHLDPKIRLWDPSTGLSTGLSGHADKIQALALFPDGRLISGGQGAIQVWDLVKGEETARITPDAWTTSLLALADGRLVSGHYDGTTRIWDVEKAENTATYVGHNEPVDSLALLSDGRLTSGHFDGVIRVWDMATGRDFPRFTGHTSRVSALIALPNGRFVSGSHDRTIRLWDVAAEGLGSPTTRLEVHARPINSLVLLSDGRLASGSYDNTVRLWNVATQEEAACLKGSYADTIWSLVELPGQRLAACADGTNGHFIVLWDVATDQELGRLEPSEKIEQLVVLDDGRLAGIDRRAGLWLWDQERGQSRVQLQGLPPLAHYLRPIHALASLDHGKLATGCFDGTVRIWDTTTGAETSRFEGHSQPVTALISLADGRLTSCCNGGVLRLWDTAEGKEIGCLDKDVMNRVRALVLLPDGRLATGSADKTIRLWDVALWKETTRLEVDAAVTSLAKISKEFLVAGDDLGRLHWLEVLDESPSTIGKPLPGSPPKSLQQQPRETLARSANTGFSFWRLLRRATYTK